MHCSPDGPPPAPPRGGEKKHEETSCLHRVLILPSLGRGRGWAAGLSLYIGGPPPHTRKTNQHVILESRLRFLMSFNLGW